MKKKKIVTEQNNGRQAQHQAHGKPNRLQRKQTHRFSKKKKKNQTPIQSKSLNQKPQISTSEITKAKANLKTEQQSNTSPWKLDRSSRSPDSRAYRCSSEITCTLSEIGPIQSTSLLGCSSSSFAPHCRSQIARRLDCSDARCSILSLSQSLTEMKSENYESMK